MFSPLNTFLKTTKNADKYLLFQTLIGSFFGLIAWAEWP